MPASTRTSSRVKAPRPEKHEKMLGFNPYPPRKVTTRQRTVNYREPESDSDDEVVYLGQRTVPRTYRIAPTPTLPDIILGEEDYLTEPVVKPVKEQPTAKAIVEERVVGDTVVAEHKGRSLLQTLPYEVCYLHLPHQKSHSP
jgi:hypothetical protein